MQIPPNGSEAAVETVGARQKAGRLFDLFRTWAPARSSYKSPGWCPLNFSGGVGAAVSIPRCERGDAGANPVPHPNSPLAEHPSQLPAKQHRRARLSHGLPFRERGRDLRRLPSKQSYAGENPVVRSNLPVPGRVLLGCCGHSVAASANGLVTISWAAGMLACSSALHAETSRVRFPGGPQSQFCCRCQPPLHTLHTRTVTTSAAATSRCRPWKTIAEGVRTTGV